MNGAVQPISWESAGWRGWAKRGHSKKFVKKWHKFNSWYASTPMPIQEPQTSKYPDGVTAWAARLCSPRPDGRSSIAVGCMLQYLSDVQVGQVIGDQLPAAPYKKSRLNQSAFSSHHKRYDISAIINYRRKLQSLHGVVTQSC